MLQEVRSILWTLAGVINEAPRDKTNKMTVRPANTQISLGIRPIWSESSLCAQWVAKDLSLFFVFCCFFFMRTAKPLIRLGGCQGWSESSLGALLVLSWGGSYDFLYKQYECVGTRISCAREHIMLLTAHQPCLATESYQEHGDM